MSKSNECKAYLCEHCNDPNCEHHCHKLQNGDRKVIAPM